MERNRSIFTQEQDSKTADAIVDFIERASKPGALPEEIAALPSMTGKYIELRYGVNYFPSPLPAEPER